MEKFNKEANRLLDKLWYDETTISFANKAIEDGNYTVLPDSIALVMCIRFHMKVIY